MIIIQISLREHMTHTMGIGILPTSQCVFIVILAQDQSVIKPSLCGKKKWVCTRLVTSGWCGPKLSTVIRIYCSSERTVTIPVTMDKTNEKKRILVCVCNIHKK